MSFSSQVAKFAKKSIDKMDKIVRGTALDIFGRVVMRTPVGNPSLWESPPPKGYTGGRLRNNWQMDVGKKPNGTIETADPGASDATASAAKAAMRIKAGDRVFIMNNLPYALPVENGWSTKQAPQGMVKVTVSEFGGVVRQANR